jgi:hypothetical protein
LPFALGCSGRSGGAAPAIEVLATIDAVSNAKSATTTVHPRVKDA